MGHIHKTIYHSRSHSPQQQDERAECKDKCRHKLGSRGYKAAMPKWAKKEQELSGAGIPNPLEGFMVRTRNWIQDHSYTDDNGRLITSSSEVTIVAKKAKTLTTKEKTGEFKS
jgi:hypothetical protein